MLGGAGQAGNIGQQPGLAHSEFQAAGGKQRNPAGWHHWTPELLPPVLTPSPAGSAGQARTCTTVLRPAPMAVRSVVAPPMGVSRPPAPRASMAVAVASRACGRVEGDGHARAGARHAARQRPRRACSGGTRAHSIAAHAPCHVASVSRQPGSQACSQAARHQPGGLFPQHSRSLPRRRPAGSLGRA